MSWAETSGYLPQQQKPLPPDPAVEGDLKDGREIQAPEEHPPEHAGVEAHDEPGPEPSHMCYGNKSQVRSQLSYQE